VAAIPLFASLGATGFCQAVEPIETHLARRIIGRTVENYDGDKLGKVKDFVIEMRSGQVKYALISSGGVAGFGSAWTPVPPQAVSLATAKQGTVALGGKSFRWEKAPTLRKKEVAMLSAPGRMREIYGFYGQQPSGTGVPAGALQLASDLIGAAVVNRQQEKIGKVSDLVVDLTGQKPAYAIISTTLSKTERSFAMAVVLLSLPVGNKVVVDASRGQLEQAQPFDQKAWQAASAGSGEIYSFPDGQATSTRRYARDKDNGSLTPFDQSESKADRKLTQQIRQALMKDTLLTLTAKNIKIITVHGKVTLRGPVRREQEKEEIARKAAQIAGANNVMNQIEVEGK